MSQKLGKWFKIKRKETCRRGLGIDDEMDEKKMRKWICNVDKMIKIFNLILIFLVIYQ